jgi:hypothetical protein
MSSTGGAVALLTVVDQPAETFGSLGAQLLFERIADKAGSATAASCYRPT